MDKTRGATQRANVGICRWSRRIGIDCAPLATTQPHKRAHVDAEPLHPDRQGGVGLANPRSRARRLCPPLRQAPGPGRTQDGPCHAAFPQKSARVARISIGSACRPAGRAHAPNRTPLRTWPERPLTTLKNKSVFAGTVGFVNGGRGVSIEQLCVCHPLSAGLMACPSSASFRGVRPLRKQKATAAGR